MKCFARGCFLFSNLLENIRTFRFNRGYRWVVRAAAPSLGRADDVICITRYTTPVAFRQPMFWLIMKCNRYLPLRGTGHAILGSRYCKTMKSHIHHVCMYELYRETNNDMFTVIAKDILQLSIYSQYQVYMALPSYPGNLHDTWCIIGPHTRNSAITI